MMNKYPAVHKLAGQARSARVRAYEYLSNGILQGEFPEGMYLDEASVAGAIGISRTPVREALRQLSSEKYVNLVPRRGAQVRHISVQEMEELYEARFFVESAAIDGICKLHLGVPADTWELITQMETYAMDANWYLFAQADYLFHSKIVHTYENTVLGELYNFLSPRQMRLAVRSLERSTEIVPRIHKEHRALLAAIMDSNSDQAREVLAQHLISNPSVASLP